MSFVIIIEAYQIQQAKQPLQKGCPSPELPMFQCVLEILNNSDMFVLQQSSLLPWINAWGFKFQGC